MTDARIVAWRATTMGRFAELGDMEWRVGKGGSSASILPRAAVGRQDGKRGSSGRRAVGADPRGNPAGQRATVVQEHSMATGAPTRGPSATSASLLAGHSNLDLCPVDKLHAGQPPTPEYASAYAEYGTAMTHHAALQPLIATLSSSMNAVYRQTADVQGCDRNAEPEKMKKEGCSLRRLPSETRP